MEVKIDGIALTLDEPLSVLNAARRVGVEIPTLCWHPRVSILGACRLCMIEVEGINRLLAACTTQVSDGMSVLTDTPQLRKVRETMLELILCRHPLDCPTCVKGGECELQNLSYRYSAPENRFPENPAPYAVSDSSPFVERDPEKCVLCRRCVRVCREVRGTTILGAMERGYHKRVGTYFQQPLNSDFQEPYNCEFCGSCINICPVGALNSKVRKFRARTWEGEKTATTCPFCSVGCRLTLQVKEGELVRTLPLEGPNNEDQACFRGRFGTDFVNAASRIIAPMIKRDGTHVPVDRGEGVAYVAGKIRDSASTEAWISSSLTREEARAAAEFVKSVAPGTPLVRAVDTLGMEEEKDYADLVGACSWNDLDDADLVVVAGQDFTAFEPVAGVRIRLSRRTSGAGLVVLDARDALLGGEADQWLRPGGGGLPLLLGAVVHSLSASHGASLKKAPEASRLKGIPGEKTSEAEKALGLEEGSIDSLAALLAEKKKIVFVSHRGWYDETGAVPRLLRELDGLLAGGTAKGILYFGKDCNSRGAAGAVASGPSPAPVEEDKAPSLLLLFGADPLGSGLPSSKLLKRAHDADTVVLFDTFLTDTALAADVLIPLPHFAEKDGTFVSATGLVQEVRKAMPPPPGVGPLWDVLDDIAEELGKSLSFAPSFGEEADAAKSAGDGEMKLPAVSLPPAEEKCIVLCGIRVADHRLRLVAESAALFPGKVATVHPSALDEFGLTGGESVQLRSGGAAVEVTVRADLKTPRGQVHLPFDPADGDLAAFVRNAERGEGWPSTVLKLSSMENTASGGEGKA